MWPEVEWTLGRIKANWSVGNYADIPLERIDRDEKELLDGSTTEHETALKSNNYVGATLADSAPEPIGTEYDHEAERVVAVRIEGLDEQKYGYVDTDASLPPSTPGDPVPWSDLVSEIRRAILTDRTFPAAGDSNTDFTDVTITNENPRSSEYDVYYRYDFELLFSGYEDLP